MGEIGAPMTAFSRRAIRLPLLTMAASDITTSYTLLGTLTNPVRIIKFKNNTNGDLLLTYDPSVDMISLVEGERDTDDIMANGPANADVFDEVQGRSYYVKWAASAPGSPSGNVCIECICASSGA